MAINQKNLIQLITQHSISLCTGYVVWLTLYTHMPITQEYTTDVSFFNLSETISIEALEEVTIALQAPRAILDTLKPIVYIDAQTIPLDTSSPYHIDHKNLLIPYSIDMVHCYPQVITITKKKLYRA